jgi:hypothetical protein
MYQSNKKSEIFLKSHFSRKIDFFSSRRKRRHRSTPTNATPPAPPTMTMTQQFSRQDFPTERPKRRLENPFGIDRIINNVKNEDQ